MGEMENLSPVKPDTNSNLTDQRVGNTSQNKENPFKNTGKKIIDFLTYKALKIKEYFTEPNQGGFDRLNQSDFDQLLDFEFQEHLKDNPPIVGIFSPEVELEKIKALPKEERRESISVFKEKLVQQRKALATMRVFIERNIEFDNDVPKENLLNLINKFGNQYGFDQQQRQISEQLINRYYENRKRVLDARRQFEDDYDLVKFLTGVSIDRQKKVDVSVGPMAFVIKVDTENAKKINDDSRYEGHYAAFAGQSKHNNPVYFNIINQDYLTYYATIDPTTETKWNVHENEHQKNKLFREIFEVQEIPGPLNGGMTSSDPEIRQIAIEDYLNEMKTHALFLAEDEILGCLQEHKKIEEFENIFFEQGENKPYDYLAPIRSKERFKNDPIYQEAVQKILVREYKETIQKALFSYARLTEESNYSIQEAIALLTDKPLDQWPKTVKRLLE